MRNRKKVIIQSGMISIVLILTGLAFGIPSVTNAALIPASCQSQSCTVCEFFELISNIINFLVSLAGALALLGVVLGGIRYITAGSNPGLLTKAKDTLKNTAIGFLLTIGGWLIITITLQVLSADQNQGSWFHIQCSTIELQSGNASSLAQQGGRATSGGGTIGTLKDREFRSVQQWIPLINKIAQEINIDPCYLATILRKESNGNANVIGNDVYTREYLRQKNGSSPVNQSALDRAKALNNWSVSNPPYYGLAWACPDKSVCTCPEGERCTWGFGLTQLTIFRYSSSSNPGYKIVNPDGGWLKKYEPTWYSKQTKQWYTPAQLMDPETSIRLGAYLFAEKMSEANSAGEGLEGAFGRYNGGPEWKDNNGKNYSKEAMTLYNLCVKDRTPAALTTIYPAGTFSGRTSCSDTITKYDLDPDPTCGLEKVVYKEGINANITGYGVATYLRPEVAAALRTMANDFAAKYSKPLFINNGWRSAITQQCLREKKGSQGVGPVRINGISIGHGSGMSIDFQLDKKQVCGAGESGTQYISLAEREWMVSNGAKYGFSNLGDTATKYNASKDQNGKFCGLEAWHFDYFGPGYDTKGRTAAQPICLSQEGKRIVAERTVNSGTTTAPTGNASQNLGLIGDSLTNATPGYGETMQTQCNKLSITKYSAVGRKTSEMLALFPTALNANHGTYIIWGGVNNLDDGAAKIKADLEAMYKAAKAQGKTVVGVTIMPYKGYASWTTEKNNALLEVNAWIRSKQGGNDYFVDAYTSVNDNDALQAQYDSGDHLHLNGEGQTLIGNLMYQTIFGGQCQ